MARLLTAHAGRTDFPALVDDAGTTSWSDLDRRTNRLIDHLRSAGVTPGERIALLAGNRREVFEVLMAAAHSGILVVPVNWHFAPDEVAYVVDNSGSKLLITDRDHEATTGLAAVPRLTFGAGGSYETALAGASGDEPDDQMMGGVMFYTSGTTGRPKGVQSTAFATGVPPEVYQLMAAGMVNIGFPTAGGGEAGPGEPGVIHVRNTMGTDFEYLGEPAKTAEAHSVAGMFTLGDIGYLDADGYLYLSDRKIDMIISGGVNIYPAEIEGVIAAHPAVVDVAVFGVPDEEFGEQVKAAVELVPGLGWTPDLAADLDAHVRARLAGYKAPRSYDVVDTMPRSEAGKLLKRELRSKYWEGTGRSI